MTLTKYAWRRADRQIRQCNAVRKQHEFGIRNAFATECVQHSRRDATHPRGFSVCKLLQPIERPNERALLQHSQSRRRVRLQILDVKYEWPSFDFAQKPGCRAEQQRRRHNHESIWRRQRELTEKRGRDERAFVNDALERARLARHIMPAAMHRHAAHFITTEKLPAIFARFSPRRVISERSHHPNFMLVPREIFAQRCVVGRDAGQFRRVVDSPDCDVHCKSFSSRKGREEF